MKSNNKYVLTHALVLLAAFFPVVVSAAPSASSAYITDGQHSYVQDQTSSGINLVNMIACIMGAMKPDAMVNAGNYIALIDQAKCDANNRDSASNSGSSNSGSSASQYMSATVNSSRLSNADPMIVKTWIDEDSGGDQQTIFVHTRASQAPTAGNPYGQFRLDYCGKSAGGGSCLMNGFVDASASGLSLYENEADGSDGRTLAMTLNADGTTSGSGKMSLDESYGGFSSNSTFSFAYNADYFRRDDGSSDQCFSRDAADPGTGFSVWRYGLYNANNGARITRNSGFPIEYTAGAVTYHGYVGYWGLWLPQDILNTITTGATVSKITYGSGAPSTTNYTLVKSAGKLTKYTKGTKKLNQIDQGRFTFWASASSGPSGMSGYAQGSTYEAYWDESNHQFVISGKQDCSSGSCNMSSLSPVATDNAYWSTNYGQGIFGYSQMLGGELFIATGSLASNGLNSASVNVTYRTQDLVYPSQFAAIGALQCVTNCPTASGIANLVAGSSPTPYGSTAGNYTPTSSPTAYTLDPATGNLKDNTAAAVTTASSALSGQFQWGIRSGKLFPASQAGTVDAADGAVDGNYVEMGVDALTVYYVWETGRNAWNQFSAVKDLSGDFVIFEAPLAVNYTVPVGAAYGAYAGRTIVLQYNGFGDLHGIPGKCVSNVTNLPVSCETSNARYVPEFVIPFNQSTGVVSDGSTNYLVKWLDREIRLAKKDVSVCSTAGLNLPSGITLPSSASLKDPSNPASDIYIGSKPTVTEAPRVIHGQIQY